MLAKPEAQPEPTWTGQSQDLREELSELPAGIIYETYRQQNWELVMVRADGADPANLTRTPNIDEFYAHVSPDGMKAFKLGIDGCRPDFSPDGKSIAWGASNWSLCVAELDMSGPRPRITNRRELVTSPRPMKIYHVDFSSDGRYITFSRGPSQRRLGHVAEIVGIPAEGWNICVADASPTAKNRWVAITGDGQSNKEPDWVPAAKPR